MIEYDFGIPQSSREFPKKNFPGNYPSLHIAFEKSFSIKNVNRPHFTVCFTCPIQLIYVDERFIAAFEDVIL